MDLKKREKNHVRYGTLLLILNFVLGLGSIAAVLFLIKYLFF